MLIAKIGERLIRTRAVLMERGIAVQGKVLEELLKKDPGVFPSVNDQEVAKHNVKVRSLCCSGHLGGVVG